MKKIIAMLLTLTLIIPFSACSRKNAEGAAVGGETGEMAGGWIRADSPVITEELAKVFEKAAGGLPGEEHIPVAYLAHQVVAGINHLFIERSTMVTEGQAECYDLITVYEDLEGNAEILDIVETGVETNINGMTGGWQLMDSPEVTDEIADAFGKAAEKSFGADCKPAAILSRQVVSGTNYCILCESKAVDPDTETGYSIVFLYVDLEGNSEMTDAVNVIKGSEAAVE